MTRSWWSLPQRAREHVLGNMRFDLDECRSFARDPQNDFNPEEYPGEHQENADAYAAAIHLLSTRLTVVNGGDE